MGIFIDGVRAGWVNEQETVGLPVSPGRHEIQARMGWTRSRVIAVDVSLGGRVDLRFGFSGGPFAYVILGSVLPRRALKLTSEDPVPPR